MRRAGRSASLDVAEAADAPALLSILGQRCEQALVEPHQRDALGGGERCEHRLDRRSAPIDSPPVSPCSAARAAGTEAPCGTAASPASWIRRATSSPALRTHWPHVHESYIEARGCWLPWLPPPT